MTLQTPTIQVPAADRDAAGVDEGRRSRWQLALLAAIAYLPLLFTHPGWIAADTKAYLYLDPTRLLRTARYLWNPNVGMGSVTHQNIGYLFPMGPWYWFFHVLGVPTWVAQRLWMGTLLFAAATGVRYLARLLGISEWGQLAAALTYMLTPFLIDYLARTSAILMPFAGLGWLVGFIVLAVRRGGWRYPALFALVVALIGGVNATSVLLVGLAPALWLLLAGLSKEATWGRVALATLKAGVLSVGVSLWWVAGLWAEGAYGINVLRYTETFPTVTLTSLASEALRGLGYWYFYGNDKIQPWTLASSGYMSHGLGVLVSFALPALALAGAALVRWRYRAFCVLLVVLGVVLAVGAYPLAHPTPIGLVLRAIGENSTVGLAMRSSNRVIPLVVLGLALLLGAGVGALRAWRPTASMVAGLVVGVLACVNMAPLFEGHVVATNLMFPETLPRYVTNAADYLNARGTAPVLGIPGVDFGYYRWGVTMDAVWPGLLTRPYIQRQAVLQGEPASANLLRALDESIQDGTLDPQTLAPMARLLGASNVLLQSDVQYERFDTPRPQALWLQLRHPKGGMTYVRGFGPARPTGTLVGPIIDETQLSIPTNASFPPALAIFHVRNPRGLLRTESLQDPILLAGDGEGVLLAAGAGLLDGSPRAIVYAATKSPFGLARLADKPGALLVLTDTNANELDTWGTLHTTYGYVEPAGATPPVYNPAEQALPIFSTASSSSQTVLVLHGLRSVTASGYGNPVANAPEAAPIHAVDGDVRTAWTVGAFSDPRGQFLRIGFLRPTTVSRVTLQQPQFGVRSRFITKVRLGFSDGSQVTALLGPSSRGRGQTVHFSKRRSSSLTVTIEDVTGSHTDFSGSSGVGFAEVKVPGVGPAVSTLRLPTDLLNGAGDAGDHRTLVILLHRLRAATVPPRSDPELSMSRTFYLPSPRAFVVSGTARLSTLVPDATIDALLGRGGGTGDRVVSTSSSSTLTGSLNNGSWAAFDADPSTSWSPAFLTLGSPWVAAKLSAPTSLNTVTLRFVNDGRHSLPTTVRITTDTGQHALVPIPRVPVPTLSVKQGRVAVAVLHFAPLFGTTFRFTFPTRRTVPTTDHVSGLPIALPVGIAEITMPGVAPGTTPVRLPGTCRGDLLAIDGVRVPIRITGTTGHALVQGASRVTACGAPVHLSKGRHLLTTAPGYHAGWNLDTLALRSGPIAPRGQVLPTARVTHVAWTSPVALHATLSGQSTASWLVLNQSYSRGWQAAVNGHALSAPILLDGGFTAWHLGATRAGATVAISWAPQHTVDVALLLSLLALVVVLGCIVVGARRRTRGPSDDPARTAVLAWPWRERAAPSLVAAAIATAVAMAIAGPAVALVVIPLLALAWWRPPLRAVLALAPAALVGLAALYVVERQRKYGWPHNIQWPAHFGAANTIAWIAVALLLVDVAAYGFGPSAAASRDAGDAGATAGSSRSATAAATTAATATPTPGTAPPPTATTEGGGLARVIPSRLLGSAAALLRPAQDEDDHRPAGQLIALPADGLARSLALLRAFRHEQDDPDLFYRTMALDTLHRLTGSTPLFNRTVVDVGGGAGYFAEAFRDAGARVVLVEPEAAAPIPEPADPDDETIDPRERHERAVWPGRLLPGTTLAGDGLALPLPDDVADLVFSSNVLEHVRDPARFIDEAVRVARPGGQVYLSFTVWRSPWGGHETSPWHLISGEFALRRYTKKHGHPPKNVYNETLFALSAGKVLKLVRARDDVLVLTAEPRYSPRWAKWVVRVPGLRELATWNLVVLLEKL
ncbi:MAG TPA: alpha-(1-_3)-arabinofuranosyltransferase family protein [Acidimicrobiales bacterium]|nr:alpha-(1->3)-arabinofuranosyltransferase family protein [Acidimicrobiales bacterium]